MDFIKKHIEKLLLALSLVILIGVAAYLAIEISKLSNEIQTGAARGRSGPKVIEHVATELFTNTIAGLENPSVWHTNSFDPFDTYVHADLPVPVPNKPDVKPPEPFTLSIIKYTPFELMFMSYIGQGQNIAVNFITKRRSFLGLKVGDEIKDQFGGTGYRIISFTNKMVNVQKPGFEVPQPVDVSELTIQHANDNPIILVYNQVAVEKEPQAVLLCVAENNKEITVHKGQIITCGGRTYKVVDISETQVLILDDAGVQHTILPAPRNDQ